MTVQTVGSPDWSTIVPSLNTPLIDVSYDSSPATSLTFPTVNALPFQRLLVSWKPFTDQTLSVRQMLTTGGFPQSQNTKQVFGKANTPCIFEVQVTLGGVSVFLTGLPGGATCAGLLTVTGINSTSPHSSAAGVRQILDVEALGIAAGATVQTFASLTVEGPASLFCLSTQPTCFYNVWSLGTLDVYRLVTQGFVTTANAPATVPFWLPCGTVKLETGNNSAAPATVYSSVTVGG